MNIFDPESQDVAKWLMFVAFMGGIIGYIRKQWDKDRGKSLLKKLCSALLSVVTSMFVAYLVYETVMFITDAQGLAVAIGGLASFIGTDLLVAVEEGVLTNIGTAIKGLINRFFGGNK